MDSKYSKYINSRYGFVVSYYIQKKETGEDKLLVWTPTTKLSQPYEENVTKERVSYFENRNKFQYQMIFENKEEIIKDKKRTVRKIIYPIMGILLMLSFVLRALGIPLLYTVSLFVSGISTMAISEIALILNVEKLENELRIYQEFLTHSQEIEQREKQDKNITRHLNEKSNKIIKENKQLSEEGYIENTFNTYLMESMELEELKQLLLRYKMSKALEEPLSFRIPGAKILKKTPTKNSK